MEAATPPEGGRAGIWRRALPVAVCLLVCLVFYWRYAFTNQYSWLYSPDTAYWALPLFQHQARELRQMNVPLWDPHQWSGQPLLGQMNGAAYPVNWPLLWLAGRHPRIGRGDMHAYFLLMHVLAALAAYALCRTLGRSQTASFLGGFLWAMGDFLANPDWPPLFNFAVWAPLVVAFLLRAVRGHWPVTSAALSGTALGMVWLCGHHEVPVYLTIAVAATWAWFSLPGWRIDRRTLGLALVALLFLVLVSGLQSVTVFEFGRLAVRWAGTDSPLGWNQPVPYSVHSEFSMVPSAFLGIVLYGNYTHGFPFLGVCASALVAFGVLLGWRDRAVRLFSVMAVLAFLMALGAYNVFHGFLYSVFPLLEKARLPVRAVFVFGLASVPLAAYGLDAVLSHPQSPWLKRLARIVAILGCAGFFLSRWRPGELDERTALGGLAALLMAALLAAWQHQKIGRAALSLSVMALLLIELNMSSQFRTPHLDRKDAPLPYTQLFAHDDIAQFLRRQPGPLRVEVDGKEILYNFGDWHGLDAVGGFANGVTANMYCTVQYNDRTRDLLAVTHYVGREPSRSAQQELFTGASGFKVFRNPAAFPRNWTVHSAIAAKDRNEIFSILADPSIDLRKQAPLLGPQPALEQCSSDDKVRMVEYHSDRLVLQAEMACRGLVVLADTWFPGWRATVDGKPAPILEPYGGLRGIVVEKGAHRLEMEYRPWTVRLGGAMTFLGWLGVPIIALIERRRARH